MKVDVLILAKQSVYAVGGVTHAFLGVDFLSVQQSVNVFSCSSSCYHILIDTLAAISYVFTFLAIFPMNWLPLMSALVLISAYTGRQATQTEGSKLVLLEGGKEVIRVTTH